MEHFSLVVPSPIGPLKLVATCEHLVGIEMLDAQPARTGTRPGADSTVLEEARLQLESYFSGETRDFSVPTRLLGTDFQRSVWEALRTIPFGTTVSYGALATRLGRPGSARAVGAANGANPLPIIFPCHRVIGADGSLVGFGGGLDRKRWLLDHEASAQGVGGLFASARTGRSVSL